jgi:uncharacterized Zn finger protein
MYDYTCPHCDPDGADPHEVLAGYLETVTCPQCGRQLTRHMPSPHMFNIIVPTTRSSKYAKAGYQHLKDNRPATKLQIGHGGGQSPENPKGGR